MIMPEWKGYVEHKEKRNASDRQTTEAWSPANSCHKESGYLQEIAQEAAMEEGQHVWVDGTLKNGAWYAEQFGKIRKRFPSYRIAIFYVRCDHETLLNRIEERAKATKRDVPRQAILEGLSRKPEESLALLTPVADFVVLLAPSLFSIFE